MGRKKRHRVCTKGHKQGMKKIIHAEREREGEYICGIGVLKCMMSEADCSVWGVNWRKVKHRVAHFPSLSNLNHWLLLNRILLMNLFFIIILRKKEIAREWEPCIENHVHLKDRREVAVIHTWLTSTFEVPSKPWYTFITTIFIATLNFLIKLTACHLPTFKLIYIFFINDFVSNNNFHNCLN